MKAGAGKRIRRSHQDTPAHALSLLLTADLGESLSFAEAQVSACETPSVRPFLAPNLLKSTPLS